MKVKEYSAIGVSFEKLAILIIMVTVIISIRMNFKQRSEISYLKLKIASQQALVERLENRISHLTSGMDDLGSQNSDLEGRISDLESLIQDIESDRY